MDQRLPWGQATVLPCPGLEGIGLRRFYKQLPSPMFALLDPGGSSSASLRTRGQKYTAVIFHPVP
jgi:hypothetical protein